MAVLEFFETSGRNLLGAEISAGVRHHVALSVVGTERLLTSGYFRAKMAQENLIKASQLPYTIVRATQFFEFVGGIAQSATEGGTVRLPPALMQPIVSDDVADALADVALAKPINGMVELAGPEKIRQDELVRRFLTATGDARKVITDVHAHYYGTIEVNDQSLVPGENPRLGSTRFEDWLSRTIPQKKAIAQPSAPTPISRERWHKRSLSSFAELPLPLCPYPTLPPRIHRRITLRSRWFTSTSFQMCPARA